MPERRTRLMGVVNVTPDSFSDGGAFLDPGAAIEHGLRLAGEGADILDIGGESSRPGYVPVPATEQLRRILPVVEGLRRQTDLPLSIDTTRAAVATACLDAGADWINDTSALLEDPDLGPLLAGRNCHVVLMHRFDPPRRDGDRPNGRGLVELVATELEQLAGRAIRQGIDPARIILDPGLGFGTLYADSLALIADVGPLRRLPHPLLFGPSRKSFIGRLTGRPAADRTFGTAAAVAALALQAVEILRVHDVAAMVDVVQVADTLRKAKEASTDDALV